MCIVAGFGSSYAGSMGQISLDLSPLINVFSDGVLAFNERGCKMIRAPLSEFSSMLVGSFTWPSIGE